MKIGLTGSIACGKSTVSHYLRSLGYVVADADAISRALTAAGGAALPHIRRTFGDSVFFPDGTLDRRALGNIVFGNEQRRAELNALLHPLIIGEVTAQVNSAEAKTGIAFADIPLLYECGMETHFDRIWVVSASRDTAPMFDSAYKTKYTLRTRGTVEIAAEEAISGVFIQFYDKAAVCDILVEQDGEWVAVAQTEEYLTGWYPLPEGATAFPCTTAPRRRCKSPS